MTPEEFANIKLYVQRGELFEHQAVALVTALERAWTALDEIRDMHDPTNERFCPQCGWDTEPVGLPHPDYCPTYRAAGAGK